MLLLLRQIRRKLMTDNKITTYLLYAVGEIFLVVVGILIAVSIDTWNQDRKERKEELQYLANIKGDLQKDLISLDVVTDYRNEKLLANRFILNIMNGATLLDLDSMIWSVGVALTERKFTPNNTTFEELSSSGNLSLISNDSIKLLLLNLTADYAFNLELIQHETFDYREYISRPTAAFTDLNVLVKVFEGEVLAKDVGVDVDYFNALLRSNEYKSGLHITYDMSEGYLPLYDSIRRKSERIIFMIDQELTAP